MWCSALEREPVEVSPTLTLAWRGTQPTLAPALLALCGRSEC